MTPEEAKALVDKAKTYGDDDIESILAETVDAGLLAGAVIALSKTAQRYEYAVTVPVATGVPDQPVWRYFIRRRANGGTLLTALPGLGVWHVSEEETEKFAARHNVTGYRIVRRLVSEPEVVE